MSVREPTFAYDASASSTGRFCAGPGNLWDALMERSPGMWTHTRRGCGRYEMAFETTAHRRRVAGRENAIPLSPQARSSGKVSLGSEDCYYLQAHLPKRKPTFTPRKIPPPCPEAESRRSETNSGGLINPRPQTRPAPTPPPPCPSKARRLLTLFYLSPSRYIPRPIVHIILKSRHHAQRPRLAHVSRRRVQGFREVLYDTGTPARKLAVETFEFPRRRV
ncbi:hypothetical protein C8R47DRAFT_1227545 [Mycena vitilis]|nr:hypothetical protein C8R47DRAFT_1227545 [Mycena vitilis]